MIINNNNKDRYIMSKIIVSATNKGGEGKTTTSINLAEYFAIIKNKRVLGIDLDPQANFSGRYLEMEYDPNSTGGKLPPLHPEYIEDQQNNHWNGRSSIADIFYGQNVYPYPTKIKNIEFMPADSAKLQKIENTTNEELNDKIIGNLKAFLSLPDLQNSYDVIIIDTPPAKGPLTKGALKCASHLIIPAQMEQFSIEGIYGMLQLYKQEAYQRSSTESISLIGILPNQIRDVTLHANFLQQLKSMKGIQEFVMPIYIKKRTFYSEVLVEGSKPKSVFELSKNKKERQEMEEVCEFCSNKVFA